jgi:hypothetical protein
VGLRNMLPRLISLLDAFGERWALPEDVKRIAADWYLSANCAWFYTPKGDPQPFEWKWHADPSVKLPLPLSALGPTIDRALKGLRIGERNKDKSLIAAQKRFLEAIFRNEMQRIIHDELLKVPPLVAFDKAAPELVVGWAHVLPGVANWVYVRQSQRRLGIASRLLGALGNPNRYAMMTSAGARLVGALAGPAGRVRQEAVLSVHVEPPHLSHG